MKYRHLAYELWQRTGIVCRTENGLLGVLADVPQHRLGPSAWGPAAGLESPTYWPGRPEALLDCWSSWYVSWRPLTADVTVALIVSATCKYGLLIPCLDTIFMGLFEPSTQILIISIPSWKHMLQANNSKHRKTQKYAYYYGQVSPFAFAAEAKQAATGQYRGPLADATKLC